MTYVHSTLHCRVFDSNQNHQIAYFIFGPCILPHFAAIVYLYSMLMTLHLVFSTMLKSEYSDDGSEIVRQPVIFSQLCMFIALFSIEQLNPYKTD